MTALRLPALPPPGTCPHDVLNDRGECEECGLDWDAIVAEYAEEVALCLVLQPFAVEE